MSDFNDPDLERLLGRAGGQYPDVNVALEQLHGRVRRARRRRAVVMSGAACVLLFATALIVANRPDGSQPSQIGDRDILHATFPDDTIDDTIDDTTGATIDDTTDDSSPPETHRDGGFPGAPTSTTPGGDDGNGNDPTSSSPTTTPAPPTTSVFSGDGGSITVRLQDGSLTLIAYTPTGGYSVMVQHSNGDRVEVRFESSTHRTRIRIDLADNSMVPQIEETES